MDFGDEQFFEINQFKSCLGRGAFLGAFLVYVEILNTKKVKLILFIIIFLGCFVIIERNDV